MQNNRVDENLLREKIRGEWLEAQRKLLKSSDEFIDIIRMSKDNNRLIMHSKKFLHKAGRSSQIYFWVLSEWDRTEKENEKKFESLNSYQNYSTFYA